MPVPTPMPSEGPSKPPLDASWGAWRRGVYYTRVAIQNATTLTFDVLDGNGISGQGPARKPCEAPSMEEVMKREALGDFVTCPVCHGIFPRNAEHEHDDIDDIVHHRTGDYPATSLENISCLFGASCCVCTVMLSWIPYCVLSCVNTSRRHRGEEKEKEKDA